MPSLLNGLSAMGSGIATFAGAAGLESQKADLARQGMVLADQLATTRESAGRQEAGQIAAKAAEAQHGYTLEEQAPRLENALKVASIGAGATLGAAGIHAAAEKYAADLQSKGLYAQIAAAEPERQQRILEQQQQTALMAVNTQNASDLRDAHKALAAESAKATPDPVALTSLTNQITSLEKSAQTETALNTAAAAVYHTDLDNVTQLNTRLVAATTALNSPEMTDTAKAQQQGIIDDLKRQLVGAQRALQYSSDIAHGRIGTATHTAPARPAPSPGARPALGDILTTPAAAPTPP